MAAYFKRFEAAERMYLDMDRRSVGGCSAGSHRSPAPLPSVFCMLGNTGREPGLAPWYMDISHMTYMYM